MNRAKKCCVFIYVYQRHLEKEHLFGIANVIVAAVSKNEKTYREKQRNFKSQMK